MFKASEIEHADTTIGATTNKQVYTVRTKSDIENFLVMGNKLGLGGKRRDIPYCACRVDARRDYEAR